MPLLRTSTADTVRIDLPAEGEWVEVKRTLGRDDERSVARRVGEAAEIVFDLRGRPLHTKFNAVLAAELQKFASLEVAIVRWSFREPNGQPVAITSETLRALDDASVDVITERLNELYTPAYVEAETKNSSGAGLRAIAGSGQSRNSSAG